MSSKDQITSLRHRLRLIASDIRALKESGCPGYRFVEDAEGGVDEAVLSLGQALNQFRHAA